MSIAVAFIPFVLMLLLWRRRIGGWRECFLIAAIFWGSWLACSTELLSVFNAVTRRGVIGSWIVASIVVIALTRWIPRIAGTPAGQSPPADQSSWVLITQLAVLALVLGAVGWKEPPNNWDAMAYHLPRVLHWIQDGNVAFFPTASLRELEMAPGAEYIILHLQLLSGSDRFTSAVQWFSYIGCMIAASGIASLLGANKRGQLFAAVFVGTLPIACLEADSAQNDLVSSFWMACFAWATLLLVRSGVSSKSSRWSITIICGLALALALLTKSTSYIFTLPFVAGLTAFLFWRRGVRAFAPLVTIALIAILLSVPSYTRNYRYSHTLLGGGGFGQGGTTFYVNAHLGIATTFSNVLRNTGLELAFPPGQVPLLLQHGIEAIHQHLGIDPNDPATSVGGQFNLAQVFWTHEDCAPNPAHFLLAIFSALTLLFFFRRDRMVASYAAAVAIGFVGFCAYLRWQPWHSRLHLPLLVLAAPFVAVTIERHWRPRLLMVLSGLLPLLVIPVIIENYGHQLLTYPTIFDQHREARYFATRPQLGVEYRRVVDIVAQHNPRQVGLIIGPNDWEYPIMMMLKNRLPHVRVENYPALPTTGEGSPQTLNHGFNPNLKPYAVIHIEGETVEVKGFVDAVGRVTTP